jgi:membrane-bound serine protease (ClpP class)
MMIPFILLGLGLLLVLIEFYIPGAIMGIIGGFLIFASIILFGTSDHNGIEILFFVIGAAVGLVFIVRFAIWRIYSTRKENTIFLDQDQAGFQASSFDKSLIGKEGTVFTDLKLSGHVMIEGKQYQALSQTGYIIKGKPVVVIGGQGAYLIVKLKEGKEL